MSIATRTLATFAVLAATQTLAAPGFAATSPMGVWMDHTGRGAVEIRDCGGKLCGKIVWLKDRKHGSACGTQVIGDAKPVAGNKWDNGWILDPDEDEKYQVEITPLSDGKLKVHGYMGAKFLGETMIWTRAPADLKTCAS